MSSLMMFWCLASDDADYYAEVWMQAGLHATAAAASSALLCLGSKHRVADVQTYILVYTLMHSCIVMCHNYTCSILQKYLILHVHLLSMAGRQPCTFRSHNHMSAN